MLLNFPSHGMPKSGAKVVKKNETAKHSCCCRHYFQVCCTFGFFSVQYRFLDYRNKAKKQRKYDLTFERKDIAHRVSYICTNKNGPR